MNVTRTLNANRSSQQVAPQPAKSSQQPPSEQDGMSDVLEMGFAGATFGGAVVGIPAAAGAIMDGLSTPAKVLVGAYAPVVAAVGVGGYAGYKTYKGTKGHPVLTGLAALGAAAAAGIGTQVGIVPGLAFGWTGAAVAAAGGALVAGGVVAGLQMAQNAQSQS